MKYTIITFTFFIFLFSRCTDQTGKEKKPSLKDSTGISNSANGSLQKTVPDKVQLQEVKEATLSAVTDSLLLALKNRNYSLLANYIHPSEGIRFSPYGFIDTTNHLKFSRSEFAAQVNKDQTLLWGEFDGSGHPIRMTIQDYMKRFVYDVDFLHPEKRSVNKFIGTGNSLNNLSDVYRNADFTESYFSGFEEKYQGMDWRSLRLVFKESKGRYYLIAVVHDEWTS